MEPIYPDWTWEWINDWSGLWNHFNWYSFHILHVYGEAEYSSSSGGVSWFGYSPALLTPPLPHKLYD